MQRMTATVCILMMTLACGAAMAAEPSAESVFEKRVMLATWQSEDQELTDAMTTVLTKGFGGRLFDLALEVAAGQPKGTVEIRRQNVRAVEWSRNFPHEAPYEFVSFQVVTNDYYVGKTNAYLVGCLRLRHGNTGAITHRYLQLTLRPETNEVINWNETQP